MSDATDKDESLVSDITNIIVTGITNDIKDIKDVVREEVELLAKNGNFITWTMEGLSSYLATLEYSSFFVDSLKDVIYLIKERHKKRNDKNEYDAPPAYDDIANV